jgi:redox-sensitive bicupin YhaK (pirin superfamily)
MPQLQGGRLAGFQLWVNLPAKLKMTKPRYQEYSSSKIPEITRKDGTKIKIIAGTVDSKQGPVGQIAANPTYLDITLPPSGSFTHPISRGHSAFAYVFEGSGEFGIAESGKGKIVSEPSLAVLGDGDSVEVRSGEKGVRFLLISGKPLNEPVVRHGPFVMNTQEEIRQAVLELRSGKFVK